MINYRWQTVEVTTTSEAPTLQQKLEHRQTGAKRPREDQKESRQLRSTSTGSMAETYIQQRHLIMNQFWQKNTITNTDLLDAHMRGEQSSLI